MLGEQALTARAKNVGQYLAIWLTVNAGDI